MTASSQFFRHALIGNPARPLTSAVSVTIRPARMGDTERILSLHAEAFADKFGAAFGDAIDRGVVALAETWRRQGPFALRGMFVAEHEGSVIGTTTVRTWDMRNDDGSAAEIAFHETLGLWRATRSLFTLSLLDHHIAHHEGFITDVAVLEPYRRGGVARALMQRAEEEALLRNKRFLGLYVSARNEGARVLYRSLGFYEARVRRSLLAWLFFGQGRWYYMRKDLD